MEFNTFDILEAHKAFCDDYHTGQNSALYARSCKIDKMGFKVGAGWRGFDSLSDNGKEIYQNLADNENALSARLARR